MGLLSLSFFPLYSYYNYIIYNIYIYKKEGKRKVKSEGEKIPLKAASKLNGYLKLLSPSTLVFFEKQDK